MSRHAHVHKKEGKIYSVAYGFDRPLSEYFLQVFDPSMPEDEECILWKGSRMDQLSNSSMYELYQEWGVPKHHLQAVTLDLPF